jgi:iron-sulfur cluster repair protein YtfE (RIC family)
VKEELKLGARARLPDEIAFLRSSYPREDWQLHLDVEGLASFWLAVHQHLRREGAQASELLFALRSGNLDVRDFTSRFANQLNRFLGDLDGHHRMEDTIYFPRFRALDERMVAGFDLLEADHGQIHEQIVATVSGARGLLASSTRLETLAKGGEDSCETEVETLLAQLTQHLSDEEDLVIPAFIKYGEHGLR